MLDKEKLSHLKKALDGVTEAPESAGAWQSLKPLADLAQGGTDVTIDFRATETLGAPVIVARPKQPETPESWQALTPRQRTVAHLMAQGLSNKEIARMLDLQLSTVKDHVHAILHRLNLPSRRALMAAAQATS